MGVDIQTYRARIGSYRQYRCSGAIDSCRSFRGIDVAIKVSNNLKTVGCVLFIGVLLMIAGVEPNPGPREKDTAGYQCDDVADVVKGTKRSVDGRDTLTEEPTKIKLSGVSVDMNRAMLKRFFENAIDFCGKVVEVTVNPKESSAIITFDTSAAVYEIMNKRPMTILGFKIDVDVYRDKIYSESEHAERDVQGPESLQTTGETIISKPVSIGKVTKGAETSGQINDKHDDVLMSKSNSLSIPMSDFVLIRCRYFEDQFYMPVSEVQEWLSEEREP
ncbi:uncharacterized protein LOC132726351 [Ruditapes philippinarum]|uniref:uncharacterized protein LOC132726351 n=1 Tax=Ruditapes philippinarum TaxID=129788 RepID=UPI00295B379C|nr:uncharacterized protein LOC132726351 [Ruditapes philippinarum]